MTEHIFARFDHVSTTGSKMERALPSQARTTGPSRRLADDLPPRGNETILVQPSGAVGIYTSRHLHLAKRCLTFQLNHVIDLRPLGCTVIL